MIITGAAVAHQNYPALSHKSLYTSTISVIGGGKGPERYDLGQGDSTAEENAEGSELQTICSQYFSNWSNAGEYGGITHAYCSQPPALPGSTSSRAYRKQLF